MSSKKVILDTNLWISFLITRDFSFIDNFLEKGKLKLVFSEELIHEFITVASRPKFQKYFSDKDIRELLRLIGNYGILIEVTSEIKKCRDIKDNFLLNLAIDSKADYLATGDHDLLEIKKIEKTEILTIKELIIKL